MAAIAQSSWPRTHGRTRLLPCLAGALLAGCAQLSVGRHSLPGTIEGTAHLPALPAGIESAEPLVVFAQPLDHPAPRTVRCRTTTIHIRNGVLSPAIAVTTVGQEVRFHNDDAVQHRFFASSGPNTFDLGLPVQAVTSQRFEHAGPVPFYCSMHQGERGWIFIAPSPHFVLVERTGKFRIGGLSPGHYYLRTWPEQLAGAGLRVAVRAGRASIVDLPGSGRP
jgi:plastocyanin